MKKSLPDHSPLLAPNIICHACGYVIEPKPVKGFGTVQYIRYDHINEEVGCSYRIETNAMIVGEMKMLRIDGSEVKL